jgi:hypothetical protein
MGATRRMLFPRPAPPRSPSPVGLLVTLAPVRCRDHRMIRDERDPTKARRADNSIFGGGSVGHA